MNAQLSRRAPRPKILCISLTPINRDARVMRQVELLSELGDVTTVGFGEQPRGAHTHVSVPEGLATLPQTAFGVLRLAVRLHRAVECKAPAQAWVLREFRRRGWGALGADERSRWDLVVANDARVLDLAFSIAGASPVWADMHEWAPEERTHITSWRVLVAPFMVHLCRTYLPRAAFVTTVSRGIADLYRQHFGVDAQLMVNAGPFRDLKVKEQTSDRIRCTHSGAAIQGRGLERMIEVFNDLPERFTLDVFLVPAGDGGAHLRDLHDLAAGNPRIRFHDPVHPSQLPATLAEYDLGIFWIPPTHTNARLTLPNKFFDYVQARIGMAIGPSEEMVRELRRFGLGVVSASFALPDLRRSLESLTAEQVQAFRLGADRAAHALSFEQQSAPIRQALQRLLPRSTS